MNVFFRELKQNRWSFLIWLVIAVVINGLLLSTFQTAAEIAETTESFLAQYPEEFVQALNLDVLSMRNILHFFASRSFVMIAILGSCFAGIMAATVLTKEESEGTIEFLAAKPITRSQLIFWKLASVCTLVTLFDLIFAGSNFLFLNWFKTEDFSIAGFWWLTIGTWLLHLFFSFVGILISAFVTSIKTSISLILGIVLGLYVFSLLPALKEELAFFDYLTPFSYFNTEDLVIEHRIQLIFFLLFLGISGFCLLLTFVYYRRKDFT